MPESFENIYESPLITAFYYFNTLNELNILAKDERYIHHSEVRNCLNNIHDYAPKTILPILMDNIVNKDINTPVLKPYLNICNDRRLAEKVQKNLLDFSLEPVLYQYEIGVKPRDIDYDTANDYDVPREKFFYIKQIIASDAFYNSTNLIVDNFVGFSVKDLRKIFVMSMMKLSYNDGRGYPHFISEEKVERAFDTSLKEKGIKLNDSLAYSNTYLNGSISNVSRNIVYRLLYDAIKILDENVEINFNKTIEKTVKGQLVQQLPNYKETYKNEWWADYLN